MPPMFFYQECEFFVDVLNAKASALGNPNGGAIIDGNLRDEVDRAEFEQPVGEDAREVIDDLRM